MVVSNLSPISSSIFSPTDTAKGFSYGLLDTLNKHFQEQLGISRARSAGLQAAYFGAYPLASLGHGAYLLKKFGYKVVFIWGLCLSVLLSYLKTCASSADTRPATESAV